MLRIVEQRLERTTGTLSLVVACECCDQDGEVELHGVERRVRPSDLPGFHVGCGWCSSGRCEECAGA